MLAFEEVEEITKEACRFFCHLFTEKLASFLYVVDVVGVALVWSR